MAKEGESYLDELLNTVAPDWEETSITPENIMEDFDEELEEEVSLEEALAILDDLPDSEEEYVDGEGGLDDVNELLGIAPDFGDDDLSDLGDIPEIKEMPAPEKKPPAEEESSPEEPPQKEDQLPQEELPAEQMPEPEEAADVKKDAVPEEVPEEEIPLDVDAIMPEEEVLEADMPVFGEEPSAEAEMPEPDNQASSESVDVDDIFQDALSAVGYSGNDEEENEEDFFTVGDLDGFEDAEPEGITSVPAADPMEIKKEAGKKKKKGPGFFARIFGNIVTDQTAEEEEKERQEEQAAKEKKAAEKEEKKKQAELSKEEKAQLAQEAKERKKQLKAEKAAKKAEEKEEKKRLREEQKAEEAAQEVVGKINPVGAAIVIIFFATIGIFTVIGSMLFNRNRSLDNAENYFAGGDYLQAYDAISMVDVDEENDVLYKRIRMCTQMQKEVNSYTNYSSIGMRVEALDSLVKGIRYYDLNKQEAAALGIINQMDRLVNQINASLNDDFGMSGDEARELLSISDQAGYTRRLEEIVGQTPAA